MSGIPAVGVVGAGHIGRLHVEKLALLANEGAVRIAGIIDPDADRAREVGKRYGAPVLDGLDRLAREADAVIVAAPTTLHASIGGALLRANVDVLLEKPIATTREEARELIEIARKRERVLQVGHVERFSSAFRSLLPTLNRPRFIEVHRMGPYPGRATDVGVVLDLMIHDLDLILRLAGAEPQSVEGVGVAVLSATEDIANARVRFANGCIANLTSSRVSLEPLRRIRFFQADAYVSIDFSTGDVAVVRRVGIPGGDPPPKIYAEKLSLETGDSLLAQDRSFVDAVRERGTPEVTGEDGYRALDLALRIQESLPPLEELMG
ncbi:MAG: Gfo/Idh/MocA family oxidoreductase [Myxococcota bacterium]